MITAKALASELGVSIATISRTLNGKPGVSPELREKILNEAAERNTYISPAARMLATSRSQNICFAVHHLPGPFNTDPFYFQVLLGLEEEIRKAGLNLTLETIPEEAIANPENWRIVREKRADGIILIGPFIPASFILKLHSIGVPVVLIDNFLERVPVDAVVADDRRGAREVAEHIISLGHSKVAILSGPEDWYSNAERVSGFKDAFKKAGIAEPIVYNADDTTFATGKALFEIASKKKATAYLAVNDAMAMGAMDAANGLGIYIPKDVSITGFDDIDSAANWTVPLTTVQVQKKFIGQAAGRLLWARIDDKIAPRQRVDVGTKLMIRSSTGPIKALKEKK
jgi:LacI family transcriptional regulator